MTSKTPIIYLDFDGVIAASAVECVDTAIIAMNELAGGNASEEICHQQLEKIKNLAIANRYLVMPPEYFYCLIKAVQASLGQAEISPSTIANLFYTEISHADRNKLDRFKELFFASRDRASREKTDEEWYLQNPGTPFIHEFTELVGDRDIRLEIVSRKDEASLLKWIAGGPFDFDHVHGNQALARQNGEKFALIARLQEQSGYKDAIFVDDAADEQAGFDWAAIGVTPLIAGWGYNRLADNLGETLNCIEEWLNDLSD